MQQKKKEKKRDSPIKLQTLGKYSPVELFVHSKLKLSAKVQNIKNAQCLYFSPRSFLISLLSSPFPLQTDPYLSQNL